jgi:GNAT superfamily N-acetyltransferase
MTTMIDTRRASVDDVDVLIADVAAGFASYVDFAPPGWRLPDMGAEREREAELIADDATWALLALVDGAPAGHVAFLPARRRSAGAPAGDWPGREVIPGLAHLWQLFVLPEWWGRGVAPVLHDSAITEMRSRGYRHTRLFTPSLHTRARKFYEHRGWTVADEEWNEFLDLDLVEYRLELGSCRVDCAG